MGVLVEQNGKRIANLNCQADRLSELDTAKLQRMGLAQTCAHSCCPERSHESKHLPCPHSLRFGLAGLAGVLLKTNIKLEVNHMQYITRNLLAALSITASLPEQQCGAAGRLVWWTNWAH
jgi:hypothetical protein